MGTSRRMRGVVLAGVIACLAPGTHAEEEGEKERRNELSAVVAGTHEDEDTFFTLGVEYKRELSELFALTAVGEVVLEAMSFGLPVIGSATVAAVEERVQHGVSGFVFEAADTENLAALMERYARTEATARRELSAAARQAAETWPVARAVRVIRDACRQILSGSRLRESGARVGHARGASHPFVARRR